MQPVLVLKVLKCGSLNSMLSTVLLFFVLLSLTILYFTGRYVQVVKYEYEVMAYNTTTVPVLTVMTYYEGGMGNQLFWYASALSIAKLNQMTLLLSDKMSIARYFNLTEAIFLPETEQTLGENFPQFSERFSSCLDTDLLRLPQGNVKIVGYMQSWKYFEPYKKLIRSQFRLNDDVLRIAGKLLNETLLDAFHNTSLNRELVGVHIRRGDILKPELEYHGFLPAPPEYVRKAVAHFRHKYANPIFIVCSNNMTDAKSMVQGDDVVYLSSGSAILDFAALTLTDHTVMTTGSYSWWVAFLTGGDVIYYKKWAREGSPLYNGVCSEDYFLPGWIGF